jgi:hypothetical protein
MIEDMRARKTPAKKKTAFVPRALFRVAITGAGVIPFCVTAGVISLQGCGGSGPCNCVADAGFSDVKADRGTDSPFKGVADVGFSVADRGFSVADVGFSVADTGFSVAADAFGPG